MKKTKYIVLLLLVMAVFAGRLRLLGGRMEVSLKGNEDILVTNGVHLKDGVRNLHSTRARWNRSQDRVNFSGEVRLIDEDFSLNSSTLYYSSTERYASAGGNVLFFTADSSLNVSGLFGEYFGDDSLLIMTGSPKLNFCDSSGTNLTLDSKKLKYYQTIPLGIAISHVKCVFWEQDEEPFEIFCDSLTYDFQNDILTAHREVQLKSGNVIAMADSAIFDRNQDIVQLFGNPVLKDSNALLRADKLELYLVDQKPELLLATGNSEGEFTDNDGQVSKFKSNDMRFVFEDDEIEMAYLTRQVNVDYVPESTDSSYDEHLVVRGDSVTVWFVDKEMDSVRISNGISGIYTRGQDAKLDTLHFKGDEGEFGVGSMAINLVGDSDLSYKDMTLESHFVTYKNEERLLYADALETPDSLIGRPVLTMDGNSLRGNSMVYDLDTERGRVVMGWSKVSPGFFWGDKLQKAGGDTLYASGGKFTTCDKKNCDLDYHFHTPTMKLIPQDKALAKNVILYIRELPVFYIPFFVFPTKTGRRSGIISFDIGQFTKDRRFIRNVGYYYAPNDYMDMQTAVDYDEDYGLKLHGQFRYALRYNLSGSVSGSYNFNRTKTWEQETRSEQWRFNFNHSQTLGERTSLRGSGSFVSSKNFFDDQLLTPEETMNQDLKSSVYLSSRIWDLSVNAELSRSENLQTGDIRESLPSIRFSLPSKSLGKDDSFLEDLKIRYSGRFINSIDRDTSTYDSEMGMSNTSGISFPLSWKSYFTLRPTLDADLNIYDESNDGEALPVLFKWKTGANLGTTVYGTFPLNIGRLQDVKHTVSPSVSYSFTPSIDDPSIYPSFLGSIGSTENSQSANFSLSNSFYARYLSSESEELKKLSLFSLKSSCSYNIEDDVFSDITSTASSKVASFLNLSLSAIHSLYQEGESEPSALILKSAKFTNTWKFDGRLPFNGVSEKWSTSITHYFSKDFTSSESTPQQWIKFGVKTNITQKWSLKYDIYYDIDDNERISQSFEISRDMHCWQGTLKWYPTGTRKGFYFKIFVKELPDLKIEGSRGGVR